MSVRRQLQLITLIPLVGLLVVTALQTQISAGAVKDAGRALTLATTSTATVELLHQLGREWAEAVALRDRGGAAAAQLVTAAQGRSDNAASTFLSVLGAATDAAPGLESVVDSARSALAELPSVRALASPESGQTGATTVDVQSFYAPVTTALLAVAEAIPGQLIARELANMTAAVAAIAAAKVAFAGQRDALRSAFRRHAWDAAQLAGAIRLAAVEQERIDAFRRVATADQRANFDRLVRGVDVDAARLMREAALGGGPQSLAVDSDAWYVAASHTIRWMHEIELAIASDVAREAASQRDDAMRSAMVTIASAITVAIAAAAVAAAVATRTSRRLGHLRDAALRSATELPAVVDDVAAAADPSRTHDLHARRLADHLRGGDRWRTDEIGQVTSAFAVTQTTALQLAADQAVLRQDIEALVVALARRSQKLVQRQFAVIDELERSETDPDTLGRYYAIDHLAARMRRNDENLLVLAGAEPGRRFTGPFPLLDVVRAASAEIADYPRIDTSAMPDVAIAGHVVGDLVHLMAELLENAAKYSPPGTKVLVTARHNVNGFHIAIYDTGIGLTTGQLKRVNARLARPTALTSALAGTLGLLVVARLAARHNILVELRSNQVGGTAALVTLPHEALVRPADHDDASRRAGQRDESALRPPAYPALHRSSPGATVELAWPQTSHTASSAWFANGASVYHSGPGGWSAPGDAERARVADLTRSLPTSDGTTMPKRHRGAHLYPGSVPNGHYGPIRTTVDPESIRAQLAGLSRGIAAARPAPHSHDDHMGQTQ